MKRFNAELELLIGRTRSFEEGEDEKLLRERQLNYMRFNFEYVFWFRSYQKLINLRLVLPISLNTFGTFLIVIFFSATC